MILQPMNILEIKANDIENWILNEKISSRSRLSVFLRKLINSTNKKITRIDFPGMMIRKDLVGMVGLSQIMQLHGFQMAIQAGNSVLMKILREKLMEILKKVLMLTLQILQI